MIRTLSKFPDTDMKSLRLVAKSWRAGVDECMDPRQVNLSVLSNPSQKQLITTIKLPLSRLDSARILQCSKGEQNWVFANALRLVVREINETIDNADFINVCSEVERVAMAMAYIFKKIQHLEITVQNEEDNADYFAAYDCRWNGGVATLMGPFLRKMTTVVRMKLWATDCVKALEFLPVADNVEQVVVRMKYYEYPKDWADFLRLCHTRLKLFRAPIELVYNISFPQLAELETHDWGKRTGEGWLRNEVCIDGAAPNLRVLKIFCSFQQMVLLAELTHRLKSLRFLHVHLVPVDDMVDHLQDTGYQKQLVPRRPSPNAKLASDRLEKVWISSEPECDLTVHLVPHLFASTTEIVTEDIYVEEDTDKYDDRDDEEARKVFGEYLEKKLPVSKLQMTSNARDLMDRNFVLKECEKALLLDLLEISACVTGPVLFSKQLWKYVGGSFRISFKSYKKVAALTLYVDDNKDMSVPVALVGSCPLKYI